MIIPLNGIFPRVHPTAWLAPTAAIIGDVEIGEKSSVWFGTVVRGDVFKMKIGKETNIQDNCILHGTHGKVGVVLGDRVTVGHRVILHGCHVKDGSLIGMGSILMDGVQVGKNSLVAAGSLVTEGAIFEDESMIMGSPAKFKRKLSAQELELLKQSSENYKMYTTWYTGLGGKIP